MIYDTDSTARIGKPCRVFDATGREAEFVVWCDTETGQVRRQQRIFGVPVIVAGEIELIHEFLPAPLRVVFVQQKDTVA